jgi:hypothetical protein
MQAVKKQAAGGITEQKTRINHFGGESELWRNLGVLRHSRNLLQYMLQSTINSIKNAISTVAKTSRTTVQWRWQNGGRSQREIGVGKISIPRDFSLDNALRNAQVVCFYSGEW